MTAAAPGRPDRLVEVDRRGRDADSSWLFGLFAALLAVALILHQLWWDGFEIGSAHFVVVVAALCVLARPSSVTLVAIMLAAEVVAVGRDLPYVGDHTLLVFVTAVCALTYLGWTALRTRRLPRPGDLFDELAPFLRLQLIIVYAAAGVAKLNSGFLDPQTSCAATMSAKIVWFDPSLLRGTWQVTPAIWATVLIELALPVALAVPRTRVPALVLGCGFHVVLALAGNVPFSALALALYVAFLPRHTVPALRALADRHRRLAAAFRPARTPAGLIMFVAAAVALWLIGARLLPDGPGFRSDIIGGATRLIVVGMVAAAAVLFMLCRRTDRTMSCPGSVRRRTHPVFVVGVALLLVNAACPYLGLKSESTFTMFSNLRTEQGTWNHVLIPESLRVFTFQDDLVTVTATDDAALRARTQAGTRLTRFEFDRFLRSHPRAGVRWTVGDDPTVRTRVPIAGTSGETIWQGLLHFKDVRPPEQGDCG